MIGDVGNKCCGCTVCEKVCPQRCISMRKDDLGFAKPVVDEVACIRCGQCRKVCPGLGITHVRKPASAFCGWHSDDDIRRRSSSGGAFHAIATSIIADGGCVFGAVFESRSQCIMHQNTEDVALEALQGSKYVQSDLRDTFDRILRKLRAGDKVLFVGTPCQVNGLKNLVGEGNANLLTCDFICHGVASPYVFSEYLAGKGRVHHSPAISINFRNKRKGWPNPSTRIEFESKKVYCRLNKFDSFFQGFNDNVYLAHCCYRCDHNRTRSSDITLSDFWNYRKYDSTLDAGKGLSLVFSNTEAGGKMLQRIKSAGFHLRDVPLETVLIDLSGRRLDADIRRREKFSEAVRRHGVRIAFENTIGVSSMGVFLRKIQRKGWKWLILKLKSYLHE